MPTEGEKLKIRRLVATGRSYQQIADELPGWRPRQIRHLAVRMGWIKPQRRQPKMPPAARSSQVDVAHSINGRVAAGMQHEPVIRPMAATMAERDRAYGQERSLTATIFGDPPAGRSALDKRMAGAR